MDATPRVSSRHERKFLGGVVFHGVRNIWDSRCPGGRHSMQQQEARASQPMADNYVLATNVMCIRLHVFA